MRTSRTRIFSRVSGQLSPKTVSSAVGKLTHITAPGVATLGGVFLNIKRYIRPTLRQSSYRGKPVICSMTALSVVNTIATSYLTLLRNPKAIAELRLHRVRIAVVKRPQ